MPPRLKQLASAVACRLHLLTDSKGNRSTKAARGLLLELNDDVMFRILCICMPEEAVKLANVHSLGILRDCSVTRGLQVCRRLRELIVQNRGL